MEKSKEQILQRKMEKSKVMEQILQRKMEKSKVVMLVVGDGDFVMDFLKVLGERRGVTSIQRSWCCEFPSPSPPTTPLLLSC